MMKNEKKRDPIMEGGGQAANMCNFVVYCEGLIYIRSIILLRYQTQTPYSIASYCSFPFLFSPLLFYIKGVKT